MALGEVRSVESGRSYDNAVGSGIGQDLPEYFFAFAFAFAVVAFGVRRIGFAHRALGVKCKSCGGVGADKGEAADAGGHGGAGEVRGAVAVDRVEVGDAAGVKDAGGV